MMVMIPILCFFFATQRLDCKLAPRVASARKDLAVFRQPFALLHAHDLCLAGWVANGTRDPHPRMSRKVSRKDDNSNYPRRKAGPFKLPYVDAPTFRNNDKQKNRRQVPAIRDSSRHGGTEMAGLQKRKLTP
jgi:hypothetical protein